MGLFIWILNFNFDDIQVMECMNVSVLAFANSSFTIKSTQKISKWTSITVSSKYLWWLAVHSHAHCLLHTVTAAHDEQLLDKQLSIFASQKNAENAVKIKERREIWALFFVTWPTLEPKDSRGLVTPDWSCQLVPLVFLWQVTDQQQ